MQKLLHVHKIFREGSQWASGPMITLDKLAILCVILVVCANRLTSITMIQAEWHARFSLVDVQYINANIAVIG